MYLAFAKTNVYATNMRIKKKEKKMISIEAVHALLSVGEIWECACGKNRIANVLKDNNYKVFSSDLIDRGVNAHIMDFLQSDRKTNNIITNPPFKYALQFVKKALELADGKVAMLLRVQFLEGKER